MASSETGRLSVRREAAGGRWARVGGQAVLLIITALFIIPFLWIISTSLRLPKESFSLPPAIFPTAFHIENYGDVFRAVPFVLFFLNSLKIAAAATFGQVITSSMAAYAFARIKFPGRDALFFLFLTGLMISNQVIAIPQFVLVAKARMVDNSWSLVLLWLLNLEDVALTHSALSLGAVEVNVVMSFFLRYGFAEAALIKMAVVTLGSLYLWSQRRHTATLVASVGLATVYALVVVFQVLQLAAV